MAKQRKHQSARDRVSAETADDRPDRRPQTESERPSERPPPRQPSEESNPAHNLKQKGSYAGRPDQDIKHTTGPGAGGATEWGGGNKNHPSRIAGKPPGT